MEPVADLRAHKEVAPVRAGGAMEAPAHVVGCHGPLVILVLIADDRRHLIFVVEIRTH